MQTVEKISDLAPIDDQEHRRRLTQWRQQREKIAEVSRQERQRLEESERQQRMHRLEKARISKAVEEAEDRSHNAAAQRAERMILARNKLSDRADLDATVARMVAGRRRHRNIFAVQIAAFLLLPMAAVAYYLFAMAAPNFATETRFRLETDAISADMVADMIRSPMMLNQLEAENGYSQYFASDRIDPIGRLNGPLGLRGDALAHFRSKVQVTTREADGAVTLLTHAPDLQMANAMAETILSYTSLHLRDISGQNSGASPIMIYQPTTSTGPATVPQRVEKLAFACVSIVAIYLILSSGLAAIRRHATP